MCARHEFVSVEISSAHFMDKVMEKHGTQPKNV
jgi:hypothetical protein